jgi:hypothetical protein
MGAEASKVVSKSESLWPRFKRCLKQKSKNQSSKPAAFSNYAVEISPTCFINGKSKALVRIVSISRDGEFVPVILSPVGKAISNERQPTKTPVIEQPKAQEIRQKKEIADSIPGPIEHLSKSSRTSSAVNCKRSKLWKFINFHRKVSSNGSKCQGIKSATLPQFPRPGMNSTMPNFRPKKINMSAERKGTIRGDTTSEGEGYSMAINLSILIIIMACLVVFSNRLLAIVYTSLWWYLLPSLLEKNRLSAAAAGGVNSGRSDVKPMRQRKFKESPCDFNGAIELFEYRKKDCGQRGFCRGAARPLQFLRNNLIPRFRMYKLVISNRMSVSLNISRRISHVGVGC